MGSMSITGNVIGPLPNDPREKIKVLATELEGIWCAHIMQESHVALDGFSRKSFAEKMFRSMFDEMVGQALADSGVLGLADKMSRQLLPEKTSSADQSAQQ